MAKTEQIEEAKIEEAKIEEVQAARPENGIHVLGWLNGQVVAIYKMPLDNIVLDARTVVKGLSSEVRDFVPIYLAEVLKFMMQAPDG